MNDKCFCHFNGYAVKDAKARSEIETIKEQYANKLYVEDAISNIEISSVEPVTTTGVFNVTDFIGVPIEANATWSLTMYGKMCICLVRVEVAAQEIYTLQADIPGNPLLLNGGSNTKYYSDKEEYTFGCQKLGESVSEFIGNVTNKTADNRYIVAQFIFGIE